MQTTHIPGQVWAAARRAQRVLRKRGIAIQKSVREIAEELMRISRSLEFQFFGQCRTSYGPVELMVWQQQFAPVRIRHSEDEFVVLRNGAPFERMRGHWPVRR